MFCRHPDWLFVRNLYGDQINLFDGNRSVWECRKCGKTQYRKQLHDESLVTKEKP